MAAGRLQASAGIVLAVGLSSCGEPAAPPAKTGNAYQRHCAACHGAQGEGREDLGSPSIAGLPSWYVSEQISKFREGIRGYDPSDLPGQQMRAAAALLTEAEIAEASAIAAALTEIPTEAPPGPFDVELARRRYANECMECHRYNGRGEIAFHSPPLVTLNRRYLERQLRNYREGRRGGAEGDLYGAKMAELCRRIDDAGIALFVDYLGALARGDDPRPYRER